MCCSDITASLRSLWSRLRRRIFKAGRTLQSLSLIITMRQQFIRPHLTLLTQHGRRASKWHLRRSETYSLKNLQTKKCWKMIRSLLRIPIHPPSSSECFQAIQRFLNKAFALALTGIVHHNGWEKISVRYALNLCLNHSISKRRLCLYLYMDTSNTEDLGHESVQKNLRNESEEWNAEAQWANFHQTKEVSTEHL